METIFLMFLLGKQVASTHPGQPYPPPAIPCSNPVKCPTSFPPLQNRLQRPVKGAFYRELRDGARA